MAKVLSFNYPGTVYHVMARGDGGMAVFENKDDCEVFLHRLGEVCGSFGWRVHARVLMYNHFHLILETPQANLVAGMEWLETDRVLQSFKLDNDGRGGRAYPAWLEARAEEGGKIGEKAQAAMKSGKRTRPRKGKPEIWQDRVERDDEDLISRHAPELGLPAGRKELEALRKAMRAGSLARKTTVSREWLGQRLRMGHAGSVSRIPGEEKRNPKLEKRLDEPESL